MLHFSAFINSNASEWNTEPAFKQICSISDGEKIGFTFYLILNCWTELTFVHMKVSKKMIFKVFANITGYISV